MSFEDWKELERLIRKALDTLPLEKMEHDIADALRLSGAFAAAVQQNLAGLQ